jgi:uncharacterized protein YfeS
MAVEISKLNLKEINDFAADKVGTMEADVRAQLNSLSGGGELTQSDMLKLQFNIAKYTLTASTLSSINKEVTESLKQTVSKFA